MALIRFDCYEVDLPAGQLRKHGRRLTLRDQPWQVLAMLLEHPGRVVSREELQRRLWPHDVIVDIENNLNTAIARVREALGDSAEHPRFVETLPRRGYRFVAPVATVPDAHADGRHTVEPPPPKRVTQNLLALNAYVQGRRYLDRGESRESWTKARELFEAAVARDPQFAHAYDAMAELWWMAGFFAFMPPKEALSIGLVHALRAVEIDNSLAEAHALLAQYLKQLAYDWTAVEREMTFALELNPASPIVLMRHATTSLMPFGRIDEAVAQLQRALDLDPLAIFPRMWLAVMLGLNRQYSRAIEQGRLVLEIAPTHFIAHFAVGIVFHQAGLFEEAIAELRKAVEVTGGAPLMLGWLGLALADSGDRTGARALLERLRTTTAPAYVPASSYAWIHLGLGEIDAFFERMHQAVDERDHLIMAIRSYSFLDRIRDDARYDALLRKLNLASPTPITSRPHPQ